MRSKSLHQSFSGCSAEDLGVISGSCFRLYHLYGPSHFHLCKASLLVLLSCTTLKSASKVAQIILIGPVSTHTKEMLHARFYLVLPKLWLRSSIDILERIWKHCKMNQKRAIENLKAGNAMLEEHYQGSQRCDLIARLQMFMHGNTSCSQVSFQPCREGPFKIHQLLHNLCTQPVKYMAAEFVGLVVGTTAKTFGSCFSLRRTPLVSAYAHPRMVPYF